MHYVLRRGKRLGTALLGGLIIIIGIILIPYPGPGWLVVFAGLAILATEFEFAARWLTWLKIRYEIWVQWLKRQPGIIRILVLAFTGLVIIITLWLLNTFGLFAYFLQLHQEWLHSPFVRK